MTAAYDPPDAKDCLFHYTSAGGFKGILETQCIYATDSAFLNDLSEITYAADKVARHLEKRIAERDESPPPEGSEWWQRLNLMREAVVALDNIENSNAAEYARTGSGLSIYDGATYVACFTNEPDQLSQWRGYGGRGYAIGFTKEGLNKLEIDGENTPAGEVVKVGYGDAVLDGSADAALEGLYEKVSEFFGTRWIGPDLSAPMSDLAGTYKFLLPELAKVKNGAFEEEQESRIIVSQYAAKLRKSLRFREGTRLVPYLKLRFKPHDIGWVYIGPGAEIHDVRALRAFLAINGYDMSGIGIKQSRAPYRTD